MNNYFESEEFREILASYEEQLANGESPYLDADDFADIVDNYLTHDRPDDAIEAVERGLAIHPDDEVLLVALSTVLIFKHQFTEARNIITDNGLEGSDIEYQKAQIVYGLDGDIDKAEEMFRKWLDAEIASFSSEDYEFAIRETYMHVISSFVELRNNALDSEPEVTIVRKWIGEYIEKFSPLGKYDFDVTVADICRHNNLSDLLVKALSQILEEQPYLPNGWSTLALGYFTLDKFEQAIEASDFALAINPHDKDAILTRAYSLNYIKEKKDAREYFEKYFDEPEPDEVQGIPYADSLVACGENELATEKLEMGINALENELVEARAMYDGQSRQMEDMYRRYIQAMNDAINVYQDLEMYDRCEYCTKRLLELNPVHPDFLFMLANFQMAQKRYEDAIASYGHALSEAEDKILMAIDIALTMVMNNYDEFALEMLKSVDDMAKKHPTSSPGIKNIPAVKALTYLKLGNKDQFLLNLKKAIDETPELIECIFKDYFPADLTVNDYYDFAVNKIKQIEENNKE